MSSFHDHTTPSTPPGWTEPYTENALRCIVQHGGHQFCLLEQNVIHRDAATRIIYMRGPKPVCASCQTPYDGGYGGQGERRWRLVWDDEK